MQELLVLWRGAQGFGQPTLATCSALLSSSQCSGACGRMTGVGLPGATGSVDLAGGWGSSGWGRAEEAHTHGMEMGGAETSKVGRTVLRTLPIARIKRQTDKRGFVQPPLIGPGTRYIVVMGNFARQLTRLLERAWVRLAPAHIYALAALCARLVTSPPLPT